jgi:hypothetical protein
MSNTPNLYRSWREKGKGAAVRLRQSVTERRSKVGDKVKFQSGNTWLTGVLVSTKGQDLHATAKVKLASGSTVNVRLVNLRPSK